MNKQKWSSLPPDIQKIMEELNEEWIEKTGKTWVEVDKEGIEYGLSKGMKIIKVSKEDVAKFEALMKPLHDAYLKATAEKGLPGLETLKFCQDYIKTHP